MRLICPGCGAQYEVDDGVIPDAGRDVQCSACGQVWFQKSRPILLSEVEAVVEVASHWETPAPLRAEPARSLLPPAEAIDQVMSAALADETEDSLPAKPAGLSPAPAAGTVPRRPLDESLLSILREEAEREAKARRTEAGGIETQEEMDLAPADVHPLRETAPAAPAPRVLTGAGILTPTAAPVPSAEDPDTAPEPDEPLPDIDAIGSSLRASADRAGAAAVPDTPQMRARERNGFRAGFVSVMALAAAATAVYGFAPALGEALPALRPGLESYAETVHAGRIWLDANLRAAITSIQSAIAG